MSVSKTMRDVSIPVVWSIARRLTDYPQFMDQVVSVEPCLTEGGESGTAWQVLFNGNELSWIEIDRYDDERFQMSFEQVEGDLAEWRGKFSVESVNGDVVASYEVEFDLGIPALAEVLHPLAEQAIRTNCMQMLDEIYNKSRLDKAA